MSTIIINLAAIFYHDHLEPKYFTHRYMYLLLQTDRQTDLPTARYRFGKHYTSGIYCMEQALLVDSTRYLSYHTDQQNDRQTVLPTTRYRFGKHYTSGIYYLEQASLVDSTRYLSYYTDQQTDRQTYLQHATGLGSTTPAVYTAWNKPRWWTLRVISRITQTNRRTDRQTYLQHATGLGSTTPAVYTAWNKPRWWTLRVISRIKTGATLFARSFL